MAILHVRKVPGAILFGIVGSTIFATFAGMLPVTAAHFDYKRLTDTAFALDIPGALRLGVLEIVFVFFFVDLFDNLGTLVAVTKKAGLVDADGRIPRLGRILTVDAISTVFGSLAGTSTVVSYIESTAGVVAGGQHSRKSCEGSGTNNAEQNSPRYFPHIEDRHHSQTPQTQQRIRITQVPQANHRCRIGCNDS